MNPGRSPVDLERQLESYLQNRVLNLWVVPGLIPMLLMHLTSF